MKYLPLNPTTTLTTTCRPGRLNSPWEDGTLTAVPSKTATRIVHPDSTAAVVHIIHNFETANTQCAIDFYCGGPLSANPDVAGLGVTISFLISAYTALVFCLAAYWSGYLPAEFITLTDEVCFKAHSRRCHGKWTATLQRFITAISDLQLITGLALLSAGWLQVNSLDLYHWYSLVYLAWTTSTVHLLLLSFMRVQLHHNRPLRYLRLVGMALVLCMLVAALFLTKSSSFSRALFWLQDPRKYEVSGLTPKATIAGCFLDFKGTLQLDDEDPGTSPEFAVALSILLLSYFWKMSQLFEETHAFLRRWTRMKPRMFLERAAKRHIPTANRSSRRWLLQQIRFTMIAFVYVTFVLITQCLNAFITTLMLLLFTLAWGTFRLMLVRFRIPTEVLSAEMSMSFGQLLALFLLLHPLAPIIRHLAAKKGHDKCGDDNMNSSTSQQSTSTSSQALLTNIELSINTTNLNPSDTTSQDTFSQALVKETASDDAIHPATTAPDQMLHHLLSSRAFRWMIWVFHSLLFCSIASSVLWGSIFTTGSYAFHRRWIHILLWADMYVTILGQQEAKYLITSTIMSATLASIVARVDTVKRSVDISITPCLQFYSRVPVSMSEITEL